MNKVKQSFLQEQWCILLTSFQYLFLFGLQHLLPVEATLGFSYSDSVDLSLSMRNGSRRGREVLWDHSVTQA